jgi:hypothetical protein
VGCFCQEEAFFPWFNIHFQLMLAFLTLQATIGSQTEKTNAATFQSRCAKRVARHKPHAHQQQQQQQPQQRAAPRTA